METKTIAISEELYRRLQSYAVPLEDTIETVIAKLCDLQDGQMVPASMPATPDYAHLSTPSVWRHRVATSLLTTHGKAKRPYELDVDGSDEVAVDGQVFRTSRSVYLPVGAQLMGEYQGEKVLASVQMAGIEYDGVFYDNPSSAAVAAKKKLGASDKAAQTNGWRFWMIELPPGMGSWQSIDALREAQNEKRTG
jgi:hypothetical protein